MSATEVGIAEEDFLFEVVETRSLAVCHTRDIAPRVAF
jgi:hypothetical protein